MFMNQFHNNLDVAPGKMLLLAACEILQVVGRISVEVSVKLHIR